MFTQYLNVAGNSQTATVAINCFVTPVNVGYALLVTGNLTCTLAYTFDDLTGAYLNATSNQAANGTATWFNQNANATANLTGSITFPIGGLRLTTASSTANTGTATLVYIQTGLDSPG